MVRQYLDRVFSSEEEGSAAFKAEHHSCEFFVMNIIVLLGWEQASGVECDGVYSILVFLGNDHSKSISRHISVHNKRLVPIWRLEDRFACAGFFQPSESLVTFIGPIPLTVFAREVIEGSRDVGEIRDEGAVEVAEAKKASHIFDA